MPITINTDNAKTLTEFTRVYKIAKTGAVKQGPVQVALEDISSVVPSNRLGKDNHRSTISLSNGSSFELAERYSEVVDALDTIAA